MPRRPPPAHALEATIDVLLGNASLSQTLCIIFEIIRLKRRDRKDRRNCRRRLDLEQPREKWLTIFSPAKLSKNGKSDTQRRRV